MRETIFFAWGTGSLGDFMVAMSDKGLVALEFGSNRSTAEDALRTRFPEADVADAQDALADVLEKAGRAIEEPVSIPAFRSIYAGRPMRSKSGRCSAIYHRAERRITALWRPGWARATHAK